MRTLRMYSPRFFAFFAILAAAAALPVNDRPTKPEPITSIYTEDVETPWFTFPLFGNLFAPIWKLFPTIADIGPKVISDDDKFQVIVNVNDYKKKNLRVKVKENFIFVQGTQDVPHEESDLFASHFSHTYPFSNKSSVFDVTAELSSNGYLIVTAPIKGQVDKSKEVDREVPIVKTSKIYKEEKTEDGDKMIAATVTSTSSTAAPTKVSPYTFAPTTVALTTADPTTATPTTAVSTTAASTTAVPTTAAPTTLASTTLAPTTAASIVPAPTTAASTTPAPTTAASTTPVLTTAASTTSVPTTAAPTTTVLSSAATTIDDREELIIPVKEEQVTKKDNGNEVDS